MGGYCSLFVLGTSPRPNLKTDVCVLREASLSAPYSGVSPQINPSTFTPNHYPLVFVLINTSFVSTTEELLGKKSSGSGLENREYDLRDPSH
jgi:hypothetical protein